MLLQAFKLKDKLDCKEQDFNSEVLLENGDSKILLFALKKDTKIPEHITPVNAALYVIEGKVCFSTKSNNYEIKEGEMFYIPANEPHWVVAKDKSKFIVIRI